MVNINNANTTILPNSSASITSTTETQKQSTSTTSTSAEKSNSVASQSVSSSVSSFALLLSNAASRATVRDSTLDYKELSQKATSLLDNITGSKYNLAKANAEVPDTDDPDLLALAKKATDYVNGSSTNPFKGMSRDQLSLIAYDDSGQFTVNERRAAKTESGAQEGLWRYQAAQKAMDEYNSTGKLTDFYSLLLDHYNSLPAIEKSQYPQSYAGDLQQKISADTNYKTGDTNVSSVIHNAFGSNISTETASTADLQDASGDSPSASSNE